MSEFVESNNPAELLPAWQDVLRGLDGLGFVVGQPRLGTLTARDGRPVIEVTLRINLPQNPRAGIQGVERVWITPNPVRWFPPTAILARTGVDDLPHATKTTIGARTYRQLCLTRESGADWWLGRSWGFFLMRCKEWLEAAAAGELVKADDPYEPRAQHDAVYSIELPANGLVDREHPMHGYVLSKAAKGKIGERRFVVGEGELPVCVFYQATPQTESWPDSVESVAELQGAIAAFRVSAADLRTVLDRLPPTKPGLVIALFGVRRPKEVLGASGEDEWIGYVIEREAGRGALWTVRSATVRDRLTPELAAQLNGRHPRDRAAEVLLIGAGSLGAYVGQSLVRSGVCKLHVLDKDILLPHNAARHAYGAVWSGSGKAKTLAGEDWLVYGGSANHLVTFAGKDVLAYSREQLVELVGRYDIVLDCSASVAVQAALSELRVGVPITSAFQVAGGRGTVILSQPAWNGAPRLTLRELELELIRQHRKYPVVREWLSERVEPIQIGAGCRSSSARVSDSMSRLGAAWVSEFVLECVEDSSSRDTPRIGVLAVPRERPLAPSAVWLPPPMGQWHEIQGWRVWIGPEVEPTVRAYVRGAHPDETAGILVGRHDPQSKIIHVLGVSRPPRDNQRSPMGCVRGREGIEEFLARVGRADEGGMVFVGEWHGHPPGASTALSMTDRRQAATNIESERRAYLPALVLISNGETLGVHLLTSADTTP